MSHKLTSSGSMFLLIFLMAGCQTGDALEPGMPAPIASLEMTLSCQGSIVFGYVDYEIGSFESRLEVNSNREPTIHLIALQDDRVISSARLSPDRDEAAVSNEASPAVILAGDAPVTLKSKNAKIFLVYSGSVEPYEGDVVRRASIRLLSVEESDG
jgi:hypothetical protein